MSIQNPVVIAGKPADFPTTGVTVIPLTAGGGAVVVSGSLSFVDPAEGTTGAAAPATAVEVAGVDGGGILRALSTDATGKLNVNATVSVITDTANQGSPNTLANAWPVEISDGTNLLGVLAHPVRVDPTGTTTQPVSGTVSINSIPAGTAVIGHVIVDSGAVTVSGTVTTAPPTNASTNVAQFGGSNVVTGTGTGGAGVPRITVSSDSVVGLAAGTQVIGHVIVDSGSVTANAGTNLNTSALALETGGNLATVATNTTGVAKDSSLTTVNTSLTTLDTDLKSSQPRAVTQTTSPWVVSNNDGAMSATRYQIRSLAQDNEIFAAQPQNGFCPLAEVPAFLGGF